MVLALLTDAGFERHQTPEGHPESPARNLAVRKALEGVRTKAMAVPMRKATEDEVALAHEREYIARARLDIQKGSRQLSTGDTHVSAASWDVALDAVGGVLNAVDMVAQGRAKTAFCAVRPPGHHATPNRGMGFCVFNNIAIGARHAQRKHGVGRVMIVDWDVHHGNGTQDIFYRDGSVLFLSTHQHPWYPGTGLAHERGEGKGEGKILNFPLPAGSGREEIVVRAFQQELMRAAKEFKPEMVFISAGFDSREGDPLGKFRLTDADYRDLTRVMLEIADQYCGRKVVSVLEGGYSLPGLAAGVAAHVGELAAWSGA